MKLMNQKELAERWCVAEATLERWRSIGAGPPYLKLVSQVRYRLSDVEAFEAAGLITPQSPSRTSDISVLPPQSPLAKKQQQNAEVFANALSSLQAPSNTCYGTSESLYRGYEAQVDTGSVQTRYRRAVSRSASAVRSKAVRESE